MRKATGNYDKEKEKPAHRSDNALSLALIVNKYEKEAWNEFVNWSIFSRRFS